MCDHVRALGFMLIGMLAFAWFPMTCAHAHASPLACESIKDPDRRHYCRARTIPSRSECEFIKDPDLRSECRATVQGPPPKR